ncbi:hypothetical protein EDB89DRAFT_141467 [Lactarius sanguifluus]|nr:hypothetical protein EDB89DRAFT_141467 [Lactarius sanguifluus]
MNGLGITHTVHACCLYSCVVFASNKLSCPFLFPLMYSSTSSSMSLNRHTRVRYASPHRPATIPSKYHKRVTTRKLSDDVLLNTFHYYLDVSPQLSPRLRGTAGPFSLQVMVDTLSDDILLNMFHHYLNASPQFWITLTHTCRRWRQIVLSSPLGLNLRLYCTYGTPVLKTLDLWPAFPIVMQYGGFSELDTPAPEDEDNIVATLKRSDRVSAIGITVTSSLLERLSTFSEPYLELEELALLSPDNVQLTFPSGFRWGPRLRTLHLTRVAIYALPQLLSPSTGIVDIQLHEIPSAGYFPPEAFTNALSGMTQLETLSLHFLSFPPRRNYVGLPTQSGNHVVLPALRCLRYRGTSKYLDDLVARIDAAPRLGDIDITFFNQPTMDASQLGRFIERIEMQTSLNHADIESSAHTISICFSRSGASTQLKLQISCKPLDWQLSSMTQICNHFSPFLFRVESLGIYTTGRSTGEDGIDGEQWAGLICAFGDTKDFSVAGELAADILRSLQPADGEHANMLPSLYTLGLQELVQMHGPLWDAAQSFIAPRQLSDHPVTLHAPPFLCHICNTSFIQQKVPGHLLDSGRPGPTPPRKYSYRGDFGWSEARSAMFFSHLQGVHGIFSAYMDVGGRVGLKGP